MWTRAELKLRAKQSFHHNYWVCVGVAFIISLVSGGFAANSYRQYRRTYTHNYFDYDGFRSDLSYNIISEWSLVGMVVSSIVLAAAVFSILFSIFIGNVLAVGGNRFFVLNQTEKARAGILGSGFKSGHYGNIVLTMFLRNLYIFLWSLLLVVPGIIKYYEYLMVPYILSENPGMDRTQAFLISKKMMSGQKMEAFLLSFSFIGWIFLSVITCNLLGIFYVNPYIEATFAELYTANRAKAFNEGYIR